jgi:D-alanyl-D-alanine carboxypeptidase
VPAIRVRHLLQHTSGLYDYAEDKTFQAFVVSHPRHRWTRAEQIRFAMTHGRPLFRPGTEQAYSDTGYILLGEMLERLTGRGLAAAYRQLLRFDRLGLDETYLEQREPAPAQAPPRLHQYLGAADTTAVDPTFDLYGGGGLVSTVDDLTRFYRALLGGQVFKKPATLRTMLKKPGALRASDSMGIFAIQLGQETCWGHNGFWGVVAFNCPSSGLTMAVAANQASGFQTAVNELIGSLYQLLA